MKNRAYIAVTLLMGSLGLHDCDDKLNVGQKSAVTANSMWQTEGDAVAAVNGLMSQFRSAYATSYIFWGEYRSGIWGPGLATNATYSDAFLNVLNSAHGQANWANLYTTINDCNLILKY